MRRPGLFARLKHWFINEPRLRFAKRVIVAIFGFSVLLIGVAMLVLPGPAIVVIPLGLAILATEFAWARHWLNKARAIIARMKTKNKRA